MAPSRNYTIGLKVAVTIVFIFHHTFLPPKSVHGSPFASNSESRTLQQQKKMVLGSRPPGCVNKCLNCRPCLATLVVPPHQKKGFRYKASSSHGDDDDHSYYLLYWKCRCGDKLFHP